MAARYCSALEGVTFMVPRSVVSGTITSVGVSARRELSRVAIKHAQQISRSARKTKLPLPAVRGKSGSSTRKKEIPPGNNGCESDVQHHFLWKKEVPRSFPQPIVPGAISDLLERPQVACEICDCAEKERHSQEKEAASGVLPALQQVQSLEDPYDDSCASHRLKECFAGQAEPCEGKPHFAVSLHEVRRRPALKILLREEFCPSQRDHPSDDQATCQNGRQNHQQIFRDRLPRLPLIGTCRDQEHQSEGATCAKLRLQEYCCDSGPASSENPSSTCGIQGVNCKPQEKTGDQATINTGETVRQWEAEKRRMKGLA